MKVFAFSLRLNCLLLVLVFVAISFAEPCKLQLDEHRMYDLTQLRAIADKKYVRLVNSHLS
jgi:hypothetical protein